MSDVNNKDAWGQCETVVNTQEIDAAIVEMRRCREEYEAQKRLAGEASEVYEEAERAVLAILKRANKSKYFVEGMGTVNIVNKYMVKTPKETSQKDAFFQWVKDSQGPDVLKAMLSINSQTLNSFINEVKANDPTVDIPGLDAPTHQEIVRFTPKR